LVVCKQSLSRNNHTAIRHNAEAHEEARGEGSFPGPANLIKTTQKHSSHSIDGYDQLIPCRKLPD
jgi:hypothetical protein